MSNFIRSIQNARSCHRILFSSINSSKFLSARSLTLTSLRLDKNQELQTKEIVKEPAKESVNESAQSPHGEMHKFYKPNGLEKYCLVWTGKYKSVDAVPAMVGRDEMERCRSTVRIRLSNILMALTLVGCCVMVYSGKQAAKRGDTLQKQNQEWHKEYNAKHKDKE